MTGDATVLGILATLVAAIVSMQWFLLRETRAAVNGLARELSDLVVTIALDVATRPTANEATRERARRMVRERDVVRGARLDPGAA